MRSYITEFYICDIIYSATGFVSRILLFIEEYDYMPVLKVQQWRGGLMKNSKWSALLFAVFFFTAIFLPIAAEANASEPPGFTIMVVNPPEDLTIYLQPADEDRTKAIELLKQTKAWESYFKFFYHNLELDMGEHSPDSLEGFMLLVESSGQSFQCPLPTDSLNKYNNLLTLDMTSESLSLGQSQTRIPILVSMRVVLTLLIEGLIFILFGYKTRRSWVTFFIVNLITQVFLNANITGPVNSAGYMLVLLFIMLEAFVFAVELTAFLIIIKEHKKPRIFFYTIVANLVSLVLGGLLIGYLPI